MGLKRAFKKLRKKLGIPPITLGNVAKAGVAVAAGGVPALGTAVLASKLKSAAVGGVKQAVKSKAAKKLVQRVIAHAPTIGASATKPPAQTMPGGAPIKKLVARSRKLARLKRPPKAMKVTKPKKAKAAKASGSGVRRSGPPKGGKDLKALSASWNAAGKPGRWIDWVKSH